MPDRGCDGHEDLDDDRADRRAAASEPDDCRRLGSTDAGLGHHGPSAVIFRCGRQAGRIVVTGELDRDSDDWLRGTLTGAAGHGWRAVDVDFSDVRFLGASTVTVLMASQRYADGRHCRLRVVGVSGVPAQVLTITRTYDRLTGREP
jgi:anti-anti-sigma factor